MDRYKTCVVEIKSCKMNENVRYKANRVETS